MRWLLGLTFGGSVTLFAAQVDSVPVAVIAAAGSTLVAILSGKIVVPTGQLRAAEKVGADHAARADKWEAAYMALNEQVRTTITAMAVEAAGALTKSSEALGTASLALHDVARRA